MTHYVNELIREQYADFLKRDPLNFNIGLELEFPILNMDHKRITMEIIQDLMHFLIKNLNFITSKKDLDNNIMAVKNNLGDSISLDGFIYILEFSMEKQSSLNTIYRNFFSYFDPIQDFLISRGHLLTGLGLYPYENCIETAPLNTDYYKGTREAFLFLDQSDYIWNFFSKGRALQLHFDINNTFCKMMNVFQKLSWVAIELFSNSLQINNKGIYINARNMFYQKFLKRIKAPSEMHFEKIDDFYSYVANSPVFKVLREGQLFFVEPISLDQYFSQKKVPAYYVKDNQVEKGFLVPQREDFLNYKSYNLLAIRNFGTIEVRQNCTPPVSQLFHIPAFYLGVVENLEVCNELLERYSMEERDRLKLSIIQGKETSSDEKKFIAEVIELAYLGLKKHNLNEEKLMEDLYQNRNNIENPARKHLRLLKNGWTTDMIVRLYSKK